MNFLIPERWSNSNSENKAYLVTQLDTNLINMSDRACPGMVGGPLCTRVLILKNHCAELKILDRLGRNLPSSLGLWIDEKAVSSGSKTFVLKIILKGLLKGAQYGTQWSDDIRILLSRSVRVEQRHYSPPLPGRWKYPSRFKVMANLRATCAQDAPVHVLDYHVI